MIYDKLRQAYPGKRIVIAEFGWPSAGYNMQERQSRPHRAGRRLARLRQRAPRLTASTTTSSKRSTSRGRSFEGGVGPYWGLFDAVASSKVQLDRPDHRP